MDKQTPATKDKVQNIGNSYPLPLEPHEEKHYLQMYASDCERERKIARDTLIERNLRLVAHIVKKFNRPDTEDLISIGTIGLIKGISSFKPDKGTKLATYTSRCIENEIRMFLRSTKKSNGDWSIQDPIGTDREGNSITLEDKLADDACGLFDTVSLKMQVEQLYEAMQQLDERERDIILQRYGLAGGKETTQREIGKTMNISRSYVSRIEKKALDKLQKQLSS